MRSFMRTIVAKLDVTLVVAPILALFLGAYPLSAQNLSLEYTFLVASGFLCDSGTCPAGAKSVKRRYLRDHGRGHIQRANQVSKCRRHFYSQNPEWHRGRNRCLALKSTH
jgi:hypothetical protein